MAYPNNELIIGIAGRRGSGKDLFADFFLPALTERFQMPVERMRFAQPLLDDLARLGFTYPDTLEGKESIYSGDTTHRGVVTGYSDWAKNIFGEDVFFKRSMEDALDSRAVVFTDVRLPCEVDFIRQHGLLIHVVSDNALPETGHRTEAGVMIDNDKDVVIYNNFRNQPRICTPQALEYAAHHAAKFIHHSYEYAKKQSRV